MANHNYLEMDNLHDLQIETSTEIHRVPETLEELQAIKKELLENRFGAIEKSFILKALAECDGNITRASAKVGMQRSNFSSLMKKLDLSAHDRPSDNDLVPYPENLSLSSVPS